MIGLSSLELELELKWFQELELELNRNNYAWKNRNAPIIIKANRDHPDNDGIDGTELNPNILA